MVISHNTVSCFNASTVCNSCGGVLEFACPSLPCFPDLRQPSFILMCIHFLTKNSICFSVLKIMAKLASVHIFLHYFFSHVLSHAHKFSPILRLAWQTDVLQYTYSHRISSLVCVFSSYVFLALHGEVNWHWWLFTHIFSIHVCVLFICIFSCTVFGGLVSWHNNFQPCLCREFIYIFCYTLYLAMVNCM